MKEADCVRVFAKAFDSVSHAILFNKFKELPINPYIINLTIDFLHRRLQRVVYNGTMSSFLPINRGVPQSVILGPVLFSVMLNDISPVNITKSMLN